MINIFVVILLSSFASADRVSSTQAAFNKTCPTPKMCDDFIESYDVCEQEKKRCNEFLDNFKKLLPKYDCQRPQDNTPKEKFIVPAMWLCKDYEDAVRFLAQMKMEEAKRLFGSPTFRTILDGELGKEFLAQSIKVGKQFPPPRTTGAFWIPEKNFEATDAGKKEIEAWYAKFDEHTTNNNFEALSEMVQFPLQVVTHDSKSNILNLNKESFVKGIKGVHAATPNESDSKSEYTPHFLSNDVVVVTMKATGKVSGKVVEIKKADILVRVGGKWKLQTLAQPAWTELSKIKK